MICIRDCTFVSLAFQTVLLTAALANANFLNRAFMGAGSRLPVRNPLFLCSVADAPGGGRTCNLCKSQTGQVWLGAKVQN